MHMKRRKYRIAFLVSDAEKRRLEQVAKAEGRTVSGALRMLIRRAHERLEIHENVKREART